MAIHHAGTHYAFTSVFQIFADSAAVTEYRGKEEGYKKFGPSVVLERARDPEQDRARSRTVPRAAGHAVAWVLMGSNMVGVWKE